MRDLEGQLRLLRRAQWALLCGMASLALLFLVGAYAPMSRQLDGLSHQIAQRKRQLVDSRTRASILPELTESVRELGQRLGKTRDVPARQDLPQFMTQLEPIGRLAGVRKLSVTPQAPQRRGDLYEQPVQMSFSGTFLQAGEFLRQAEQMRRLTRVRQLQIARDEKNEGQVEVHLAMAIYFTSE